jgi:hypothetical protein
MSIDRCSGCSALVDTDNEPEAYVEIGNMRAQTETKCLCGVCRALREEELEDLRTEPPGLGAFIAECMAADPRIGCDDCDWDVDGCSPCEKHEDC